MTHKEVDEAIVWWTQTSEDYLVEEFLSAQVATPEVIKSILLKWFQKDPLIGGLDISPLFQTIKILMSVGYICAKWEQMNYDKEQLEKLS